MTQEKTDAAIGRLVTAYKDKRTECVALKAEIRAAVAAMRNVVDASLSEDRFEPERIDRDIVPHDGWVGLRGLLDDFHDCRTDIRDLESDLKETGLGDLITDL